MMLCQLMEYQDISGTDDIKYRFHFKAVPFDKIGKPDEISARVSYERTVICTKTKLAGWNLNDQDAAKVLYWYAREDIIKHPMEYDKNFNAPKKFEYDPGRIKFPNPESFEIEHKRRIGF